MKQKEAFVKEKRAGLKCKGQEFKPRQSWFKFKQALFRFKRSFIKQNGTLSVTPGEMVHVFRAFVARAEPEADLPERLGTEHPGLDPIRSFP